MGSQTGLLLHRFVLGPHFLFAYTELLREAAQLGRQPLALDPLSDLFGFTQARMTRRPFTVHMAIPQPLYVRTKLCQALGKLGSGSV